MPSSDVGSAISRFFARHAYAAGLTLPTGWFGRPMDGYFTLTRLEEGEKLLIMELSSRFVLTFSGQVTLRAATDETEDVIVLGGFDLLEFSWSEYGSEKARSDTFSSGEVSLTALPANRP